MKIHLLILSFAVITNSTFSQSSIPNGNFENWTSATFYYPEGYPYSSNNESFFRFNYLLMLLKVPILIMAIMLFS